MLGQVELDASVMDGRTLASGAVGAVKGYPNPIEIARKVMELTPHVMLVGEGAELFAKRHGFTTSELLTEASSGPGRSASRARHGAGGNAYEDSISSSGDVVDDWVKLLHDRDLRHDQCHRARRPRRHRLRRDDQRLGFKWPGRVGDSPIIGAGNYADNRFGAAACTGRGEMAIRCNTAHSIVMYMRFGMPLDEALTAAMHDLRTSKTSSRSAPTS